MLNILIVALILGLVIVIIFLSITKLSTELQQNLAYFSSQAITDLSSSPRTETSMQVEEVTLALGPVAVFLLGNLVNVLVQFRLALAVFLFYNERCSCII